MSEISKKKQFEKTFRFSSGVEQNTLARRVVNNPSTCCDMHKSPLQRGTDGVFTKLFPSNVQQLALSVTKKEENCHKIPSQEKYSWFLPVEELNYRALVQEIHHPDHITESVTAQPTGGRQDQFIRRVQLHLPKKRYFFILKKNFILRKTFLILRKIFKKL